jgi:hypothetical protein
MLELLNRIGGKGQEQLIASLFVLSAAGFLLRRAPDEVNADAIYKLDHPPQAARMNVIMLEVREWWKRNRSGVPSWLNLEWFQSLLHVAQDATHGLREITWERQTAFLRSTDGQCYFELLSAERSVLRDEMGKYRWQIADSPSACE